MRKEKTISYAKCKDGSYDIIVEHDGHYKSNYKYSCYREVLKNFKKSEYDYINLIKLKRKN